MNRNYQILALVIVLVVGYYLYEYFQASGGSSGGSTLDTLTEAITGVSLPDPNMPTPPSCGGANAQKVALFAYAIAVAEGFYSSGAIPQQANNPGDLEAGDVGYGTLGQGITIYASETDGWNALYSQVCAILSGSSSHYSPSETFAQIGNTYSGGDSNWAKNVSATLGIPTSTVVESWLTT